MVLPLFVAGVNVIVSCLSPGVADKAVGAEGGAEGVAIILALAPGPLAFTARNIIL